MSEETAKYITKMDVLTDTDKTYIEKGGVIIRKKGDLHIECVSSSMPEWHLHAGAGKFESEKTRDLFFKRMLEFADYKEFKQ